MAVLRNNIKSFSLVCANISSNTCVDEITYITESSRLVEQICLDTHVYYQQAFCLLNILADGTIFSIVNAAERPARALNRKYREIFPFQCIYTYIYEVRVSDFPINNHSSVYFPASKFLSLPQRDL